MNEKPLSGKEADKFMAWLEKNFHAFCPGTTIVEAKIVYEKRLQEGASGCIDSDKIASPE